MKSIFTWTWQEFFCFKGNRKERILVQPEPEKYLVKVIKNKDLLTMIYLEKTKRLERKVSSVRGCN